MPLPKVALIGHSFIRRLDLDIRDRRKVELKRNFDLSQCQVKFRGTGGWKVLDQNRFNVAIAPFLRDFNPDIVVIQLGGNDVDSAAFIQAGENAVDQVAENWKCLAIASDLEDITTKLLNDFNVRRIYICEIFTRKSPRHISAELYDLRRTNTMRLLSTLVEHDYRIRIWRHRRIFGSAQEMFSGDGIHLNLLGQKRFYRSVRLAIKTAVDEL